MVYEWDNKRDECYCMYITENKSLEEIVGFYRSQNFVPRYVVDSTASTAGVCANAALIFNRSLTSSITLITWKFFQRCCAYLRYVLDRTLYSHFYHLSSSGSPLSARPLLTSEEQQAGLPSSIQRMGLSSQTSSGKQGRRPFGENPRAMEEQYREQADARYPEK